MQLPFLNFFVMNLNYETNLYLPGSFIYYVISRGGGEFPNNYFCNFDTIAMGKLITEGVMG